MATEDASSSDEAVEGPFQQVDVELECPFDDGVKVHIKLGWVNRKFPMVHLDAPELVEHMSTHDG